MKVKILKYKGNKLLFLDDYLWMWDTPQERSMQEDLAKQCFGQVLIAGYGLGILNRALLKNPKVKSITTVELNPNLIKLLAKSEKIIGEIIISDFYDLPESKKYDCVVGDIWPDIDAKFLGDYLKFKLKSGKLLKKNGKILAWGKDYYEWLARKKARPD